MKRDDMHMQACTDLNIAISQKSSCFMSGFKKLGVDMSRDKMDDLYTRNVSIQAEVDRVRYYIFMLIAWLWYAY